MCRDTKGEEEIRNWRHCLRNFKRMDVNSGLLDNLCHPVSVIKEAEELTAAAFHAAHASLMVGGTTSAVQSMVLSVVRRGEKIILPRNVHLQVRIGALNFAALFCVCQSCL